MDILALNGSIYTTEGQKNNNFKKPHPYLYVFLWRYLDEGTAHWVQM